MKKAVNSEILKSQLARALADYDNLQKRVAKEREEIVKLSNLELLVRLLSVVDMLEKAQENLQDSGLAIVLNELLLIFKEEGVEKIGVEIGNQFDENKHEVIETVGLSKGARAGTIAAVVLRGWQYSDGTIIRHTKVKVFK